MVSLFLLQIWITGEDRFYIYRRQQPKYFKNVFSLTKLYIYICICIYIYMYIYIYIYICVCVSGKGYLLNDASEEGER